MTTDGYDPAWVEFLRDLLPRRPSAFMHPVTEANLAMDRIRSGDLTVRDACVAQGLDPDEVERENERDRRRMEELRISHSTEGEA